MEDNNIPILLIDHKGINVYLCHPEDVYENLTTDNEKRIGKIRPEDANKVFKMPLRLNDMVMRNPLLVDLIKLFKTKYCDMMERYEHDLVYLPEHITEEEIKQSI